MTSYDTQNYDYVKMMQGILTMRNHDIKSSEKVAVEIPQCTTTDHIWLHNFCEHRIQNTLVSLNWLLRAVRVTKQLAIATFLRTSFDKKP